MKVKVVIEMEIPEGATHHTGRLDNEPPPFYKEMEISGRKLWFYWNERLQKWIPYGERAPYFVNAIPFSQNS